jgi:glycosyltransferase involved in cell wall biosynthesis
MTPLLVSVLTPTWQRHDLVLGAIENVRAQTYRPLEHVVVSDGEDDDLARWILSTQYRHESCGCDDPDYVSLRFVQLGRNWSTYLPDSFCAAPTTVAMLVARGEYQTFLADDERMTPDHIASLVAALETASADFAYSNVELTWPDSGRRAIIGSDPPSEGQITNALYRTDLLKRGLYPFGAGMTSDWACIKRWMDAGAVWAYVPRVTLTHRVDH